MRTRDKKPFFEGSCAADQGEESTRRGEEARGFGGRQLASRGYEIGRETSCVSRLEDPPLQQHDRGAGSFAPGGPARGPGEAGHPRVDDRGILAPPRGGIFGGVVW